MYVCLLKQFYASTFLRQLFDDYQTEFLHVKLSTTYYFQGVQDLILTTERLKVLQIFCHISHRNRG